MPRGTRFLFGVWVLRMGFEPTLIRLLPLPRTDTMTIGAYYFTFSKFCFNLIPS